MERAGSGEKEREPETERGRRRGNKIEHPLSTDISTWNTPRITEKFIMETERQDCFLFFFLKFGDMK